MESGMDFDVDPALFLHRIDLVDDRVRFVRTDPAALRRQAFLDGRTDFWTGATIDTPLEPLLRDGLNPEPVQRFIFHIGFCGSTALSRMLDRPGRALVLREPQALTDLAAYRSALDREEIEDRRFAPAISTTRALLMRRFQEQEVVVAKPSNWINNLLPWLTATPSMIRPLFMTMRREAFMLAVFRGGSERLSFVARAALHFSHARRDHSECLAAALAWPGDELDRLTLLAALAYHFQLTLFSDAIIRGGWGQPHLVRYEEIREDPLQAVRNAAIALDVVAPSHGADEVLSRHAKQRDVSFSWQEQDRTDSTIVEGHSARIDWACRWVDEALPETIAPLLQISC
jgi:hypothetical protein